MPGTRIVGKVLAVGVAVLGTVQLSASGPSPRQQGASPAQSQTWNRMPDTPERAARRARMQRLATKAQPMRMDPESDVQLDTVAVARDAAGRRVLKLQGRAPATPETSFVWIADLEKNTYRIFRISDPQKDSRRVADHLRKRGKPADAFAIRAAMENARARHRKNRDETISRTKSTRVRPDAPKPGEIVILSQDPARGEDCYGFAAGDIETWELASLFAGPFPLTRTFAVNDFYRYADGYDPEFGTPTGFTWGTHRGGGCWVELNSFAWTTWIIDQCGWYWPAIYDLFSDVLVTGEYRNMDFLDDNLPTWVWSGFGITYSDGTISWNSYHFADGEGVIAIPDLIWGHVNLGNMWTNCQNW